MNLFHLKCFCDAARSGSLSESARSNLVTHSAASQAIRALEQQLNVKLLHHGKRRFQLTEEGEALFLRGQELLDQFEDLRTEILERANGPSGDVVFGAPQSLVADAFTSALRVSREKYPQLRVRIRTGAAGLVKQMVRDRECAFVILVDDGDLAEFKQETLFSGDFLVVSSSKRADPMRDGLLVTDREKYEVKRFLKEGRPLWGNHPPINLEVLSWSLIRKLCLEGLGCGLVPDYVVREELKRKQLFRVKEAPKTIRYSVKAIWPQNRVLTRSARALLDLLKARPQS